MEWVDALQGSVVGLDTTPLIYVIRTPDAIQLATVCHEGAAFFLTNDTRLPSVPGLTTLVLDELKDRV